MGEAMNPANALVSGLCFGLAAFVDPLLSVVLIGAGLFLLGRGVR
jgi:hypothetical protein